jgi:hypothetical protein
MSGVTSSAEEIQAFKDKRAIYDCLVRYPRGVDHADPGLLKTVYHADGIDDHGIFTGNAWEFAEFIGPFDAELGVRQQTHRVDNVLIEFTGPHSAAVESYNITFVDAETPDGMMASIIGGRYLDKFERRDGQWKIAHRLYVMDWNINGPSSVEWRAGMFGQLPRGSIDMADASYAQFPVGTFGDGA